MNDFIFVNRTKIFFGKDQLQHLGEEVARFGKKVLLAYGGGSIKRIGLYDRVVAQLAKAGVVKTRKTRYLTGGGGLNGDYSPDFAPLRFFNSSLFRPPFRAGKEKEAKRKD